MSLRWHLMGKRRFVIENRAMQYPCLAMDGEPEDPRMMEHSEKGTWALWVQGQWG